MHKNKMMSQKIYSKAKIAKNIIMQQKLYNNITETLLQYNKNYMAKNI